MEPGKPSVKNKRYDLLLKNILKLKVSQADIDFAKLFPANTIYIDARERKEYVIGSIAGALNLGFENPDLDLLKLVPKDKTLIVFCSVGLRSEKICNLLLDLGFTYVYNLYGGLFEWVNCGLPVFDATGNPSKQIHGFSRFWGIWAKGISKVYG